MFTFRFDFLNLNFISFESSLKEIYFLIKLGSKHETIFFPKYGNLKSFLKTGNKIIAGIIVQITSNFSDACINLSNPDRNLLFVH